MAIFVLIHGGCHGGWCYSKVARLLREAGHTVYAPSLTGCADRKHLLSSSIDLNTHITDVAQLLEFEDLRDVVLVGHSYGGMVITGAADRQLDRIKEIVYLDAAHPKDGQSLYEMAGKTLDILGVSEVDGVEVMQAPDMGFFGLHDPVDVAWGNARLTAHPWKTYTAPLALVNGDAVFKLPRTDINCTQSLHAGGEEGRAKQTAGGRVFEIDTGHDLMLTEAEWVARTLMSIVD